MIHQTVLTGFACTWAALRKIVDLLIAVQRKGFWGIEQRGKQARKQVGKR
jgi:hypothetical protein